jgi:phosphoglycolate phosphatase
VQETSSQAPGQRPSGTGTGHKSPDRPGQAQAAPKGPLWKIDCVIYDCDGVLFDSLETNRRLYDHIATSMGRPPLSESELRYCHIHTVYDSLHHLFKEDEALEKKALEFLRTRVALNDFIVYLRMEPNLFEILDTLKQRGIRRAISTNRTTTMKAIMERFGLRPYFDVVVTALDVAKPKPDPESVEKILGELSVAREKALYVGDSEVDRETAASSGVKFIAYKNEELEADGFIHDHLDLLGFLLNGKPPQE